MIFSQKILLLTIHIRMSGPYTATLCSVDTTTSPNILTSKLTVTLANTVVVTCGRGEGDNSTTRLTVAGELSS